MEKQISNDYKKNDERILLKVATLLVDSYWVFIYTSSSHVVASKQFTIVLKSEFNSLAHINHNATRL